MDKGGNVALMAPEVVTAVPGPFTNINYTKADLWTAGTIAYEIFGEKNPFYSGKNETLALKNHNYSEEYSPPLPESVPTVVSALVKYMLSRSLYKVRKQFFMLTANETFFRAQMLHFLRLKKK